MAKTKEDIEYHESYLKEFALWKRSEEIRINEFERMIENAEEIKSINIQMRELSKTKLDMALAQHEQYLNDWKEEQND